MPIRHHHQRAIERLAEAYSDDPRFLGLIIGGSVAKGYARDDSDVDFLIVATDEEFEQRLASSEQATALFERVRDFHDWGVGDLEAYTWFMTDVEWSWMSDRTPIEDW